MAAKLEQTSTPGIYRRHAKGCTRGGRCDCSYVVVYLLAGRQRTETYGTLADAREAKRAAARRAKLTNAHDAGLHRDEPRDECPQCAREQECRDRTEPTLHEYAREWVERYHRHRPPRLPRGDARRLPPRTSSGTRCATSTPTSGSSQLDPRQVADFIGWLAGATKQPRRDAVRLVGPTTPSSRCPPVWRPRGARD